MIQGDLLIAAFIFASGLVGLFVGGFVNRWAWGFTHGGPIEKGRARCPSCGHALGARDLVPVFSWLHSKGACRHCGDKVSARLPIAELVCAVAFTVIAAKFGPSAEAIELQAFAGILLFLSLVDFDERIIPNACIVAALIVRVMYMAYAFAIGAMAAGDLAYYAFSALGMGLALIVVTALANKLFGSESMGAGDLKLYFAATLYIGWQLGVVLIVISCLIGLVVALLGSGKGASPTERDEVADCGSESVLKRAIPFGPSIAIACVVTILFGDAIVGWYLGLL